ncbi:MAG: heat-inducible transcriptional repressor HrcA [Endomicrobium sp.]|nr:heat-inducible transcriptional repressor HrcA [Endomicrobium sp.]
MQRISLHTIQNRKIKILSSIIHYHIKTGNPIGSNVLIKKYDISFSSATVRNLMSEMEKDGYLIQTHKSSGRIPTDKAYRLYVDKLVKLQNYAFKIEDSIRQQYKQKCNEIETLLSYTSKMLSNLSTYAGFVTAPNTQYDVIKNIELIQISKKELLIIFLTKSKMIKHKIIEAFLNRQEITTLKKFLNNQLKDVVITNASKVLVSKLEYLKKHATVMSKITKGISDTLYNMHDDIYINGTANVIDVNACTNFEHIKPIIGFNENKRKIIEILNKDFYDKEIDVKIGSENKVKEFKNLSVITKIYKSNKHIVGLLGIIGPKRMEYKKMILLVNKVAQILNKIFDNMD